MSQNFAYTVRSSNELNMKNNDSDDGEPNDGNGESLLNARSEFEKKILNLCFLQILKFSICTPTRRAAPRAPSPLAPTPRSLSRMISRPRPGRRPPSSPGGGRRNLHPPPVWPQTPSRSCTAWARCWARGPTPGSRPASTSSLRSSTQ